MIKRPICVGCEEEMMHVGFTGKEVQITEVGEDGESHPVGVKEASIWQCRHCMRILMD